MVKRARKKQRLEPNLQPLGSVQHLDNDAEKDDEERRLESILFGTDYKPSAKGKSRDDSMFLVISDEEGDGGGHGDVGNAMENLQDADLFFMDDALPDTGDTPIAINEGAEPDRDEDIHKHNSESEKENDTLQGEDNAVEPPSSSKSLAKPAKSTKRSAWVDSDDATLKVSLATTKRLRKLRDAPIEDVVGGTQYEARLRREFERINPAPEWATKARKKTREENKRRRGSISDVDMSDREEGLDDLLTRADGVLSNERGPRLDKGMIGVERLRDANQSAKAEGEIKALSFHPSPRVPVLMTASTDRRVRLFNIDGHTNPHLRTVYIPELPITHAEFHPGGSSILLTGPRPFYYTFDLQSGATTRSPRGLWGCNPAHFSTKAADLGMELVAFDPSGVILAVAGRRGYVHLVDWRSGSAQVAGSVKMNSGVQGLWWNRHPGLDGRPELLTLGADAEVYVWDVGERRCVRRWKEEGGYGTTVISGDNSGSYLSIGSKSGLVNVYGEDALLSTSSSLSSKPRKTLQNLTTSISTLRFNHDSQVLAMASGVKKDQMRLVHLPSLTAFSNWPTSSTPLGHVTAIDFSPTSEYIAIGNNRGRALLYQLSHFVKSY
ncbi:hypothetical protein ACEPAG_1217 [Sanghuangporus baumii]